MNELFNENPEQLFDESLNTLNERFGKFVDDYYSTQEAEEAQRKEEKEAETEAREKDKEEVISLLKSLSRGSYNTWYGVTVIIPDAPNGASFNLTDLEGNIIVENYITFTDGYGQNFGMDLPQGRYHLENETEIIKSTATDNPIVLVVDDPDGDTVAEWGEYGSCYIAQKTIAEPEEQTIVELVGKITDYQELQTNMFAAGFMVSGVIIGILLFTIFFNRLRS